MAGGKDEVRLQIPAEPGFLRLARLTAAGVASRMSFSFDEVEDLRIAVDELCYFLLTGRGPAGTMTLTCSIDSDTLSVVGQGHWDGEMPGSPAAAELPELSRRILDAVVDEYVCDGVGRDPSFTIVKRRASS